MIIRSLVSAIAMSLLGLGLSACGDSSESPSGEPPSSKSDGPKKTQAAVVTKVEVAAVKKDSDDSYVIGKTATVTLDKNWEEKTVGFITVSAKTTSKHPEDNKHWLAAKVIVRGSKPISCSENRPIMWSDFGVFEDVSMECEQKITLSRVKSVQVVPYA